MDKMIGNNGRSNPNMVNAQQHGMNRQPRPHPHQQGQNPNFNQQGQRRVPPPGSGQQQNRPNQVPGQRPHNPNMPQRQGMPNRPQGQRPPGQPGQHNNHQGQRPGQQGRPVGHNPNAPRSMNPNGPHSGQPRPQGQPGQPRPNSQGQQKPGATNGTNGPPAGPPMPNPLPKGWKRQEVVRTKGISAGIVDVVYTPNPAVTDLPSGKKFKSKLELHRYFGNRYDMALLDYRSGKLSQVNWRKSRRMKSLAMNNTNFASASKYDNYLNLPIRQTASVFKQSVTVKTNNHKNEPAPSHIANPPANKVPDRPKPIQLFWEIRFNNMRAVDTRHMEPEDEELSHEFELRNIPKFKSFSLSNENVLRSVAASWYMNQTKALTGQEKEFGKNARIFIDREQPLIPQTAVKESEVKLQEQKLKQMRKKLQAALKEYELMDYMSLEEIEQAEEDKLKLEREKANPPTPSSEDSTPATAALATPKSEELIVL